MEVALNLYFALGYVAILTMLSLLIHEPADIFLIVNRPAVFNIIAQIKDRAQFLLYKVIHHLAEL